MFGSRRHIFLFKQFWYVLVWVMRFNYHVYFSDVCFSVWVWVLVCGLWLLVAVCMCCIRVCAVVLGLPLHVFVIFRDSGVVFVRVASRMLRVSCLL